MNTIKKLPVTKNEFSELAYEMGFEPNYEGRRKIMHLHPIRNNSSITAMVAASSFLLLPFTIDFL
jgi:hypothetical protein